MTDISPGDNSNVPESTGEISRLVDWAVAALLVLGGLTTAAAGSAAVGAANRSWISRLVAEGRIESAEMTNAELIDVAYGLAWWGGIGLVVTGLAMIAGAAVYLRYRSRTRTYRAEHGITTPDATTNAIVGGVVTIVTSFIPFSPIVGGLAAGYLQGGERSDGARVGAYAGLVLAIPMAALTLFVGAGLAVVAAEIGLGWPALVGGFAMLIGVLVGMAYLVGLSALGGYLGVAIAERNNRTA